MKAIRRFVKIPENHIISIEIPKEFEVNETAELLLILDKKKEEPQKYDLAHAMDDPLFVEDMDEVKKDFSNIDKEGW